MKKLITGVVASLAILFGFASCSGDLHDSVVSSLYAEGDFCTEKVGNDNVRLVFTMTPGSDTEQKCTFTYDASKMTAWGGGSGTLNFKVVRDASGWIKDWGGKKDTAVELSVNSPDWLALEGRDASNDNPGNIVLKDLADGNTYTLITKYDAPEETLSLKCVGAVTDYPILTAVTTDGNEFVLTRSGTKYNYTFKPKAAGSYSYYLTNGYLYWGKDGTMTTTKPDESTYFSGSYKNDSNTYTIFADASKFAKEQTITSDVRIYDTSILGEADIVGFSGDFANGKKLTYVDGKSYTYEFTASAAEEEFAIREISSSWSTRWFGGIPAGKKHDATDKLTDAIKVGDNSVEPIYYTKDPGMDGNNIKITGLSKNSIYTVTIKIEDASSKKLSISCKLTKAVEAPKTYSFEGAILKGGWEGWWQDEKSMTGDATQEFTTVVGSHDASGNEFGIFNPNNNWKVSNLELGTRTKMEYSATKVDNCTMKENWEKGATYKIKIELTNDSATAPEAYITITKN